MHNRQRTVALGIALTLGSLLACNGSTATGGGLPTDRVPSDWAYPLTSTIATGTHGMVTTDAPLATQVGLDVLRHGGNAVDAAVAIAFTLAVVYPEAGNLGGGGFMVARMADGTTASLDFREKAPLAASPDMYLDSAGNVTRASVVGYRASGVPGSVAGLWQAHHRFGARPWKELLAPAIQLAEDGFTVDEELANSVQDAADRLRRFPASAQLLLPDGTPLAAGSHWSNPDLAAVLRRIAEQGPDGFYRGETADLIVAEMQRGGGLITHQDLEQYQAKWRDPVTFDYRGYQVISMPPPSSGGLTLALILDILEGYDLKVLGWHSPEALHLETEAMRRAFADRNAFLGDPDFVPIPTQQFLSRDYAARQRATIDSARATPSSDVRPGLGAPTEGHHTTHFSVVDDQGDAVALTTTINDLYGSGVTVSQGGFLLNDEMDDFTSKPGVPNMYGLVQGEANAIAPGKRMLSAMTPTIVVDSSGRVLLVTGARGGPRIISAVFQVLTNVLDYGLPIDFAVNAPRIHHQHLPDILYYEKNGLTTAEISALEAMGHHVEARDSYIGNAPSILRMGDRWLGVPDPRQAGHAQGY